VDLVLCQIHLSCWSLLNPIWLYELVSNQCVDAVWQYCLWPARLTYCELVYDAAKIWLWRRQPKPRDLRFSRQLLSHVICHQGATSYIHVDLSRVTRLQPAVCRIATRRRNSRILWTSPDQGKSANRQSSDLHSNNLQPLRPPKSPLPTTPITQSSLIPDPFLPSPAPRPHHTVTIRVARIWPTPPNTPLFLSFVPIRLWRGFTAGAYTSDRGAVLGGVGLGVWVWWITKGTAYNNGWEGTIITGKLVT